MTPSPLLRHGEYISPVCQPLPDGSGAFGQSTPEDRPETLGRGVQERYSKDVSAAPNTYAFGWIRAAYADAIEYSGIPNEGRGVVFSMGVCGFLMFVGAAIYIWSLFSADHDFITFEKITALILALFGISFLFFTALFEFSNPVDSPIVFDRRHRKIYRAFLESVPGWKGLFSRGKASRRQINLIGSNRRQGGE